MTTKLNESLLKKCKERENIEDAALLISSDEMMWRLIWSWPKISIEFEEVKPNGRGRLPDWKRLWRGVKVSHKEIIALSGYPPYMVKEALLQAQMNFWIYPDGTVNKHAKNFISSAFGQKLKELEGE